MIRSNTGGGVGRMAIVTSRRRHRAVSAVLAVVSALSLVLVGGVVPAAAAEVPVLVSGGKAGLAGPVVVPTATNLTYKGPIRRTYGFWVVEIYWGFDYNLANNHLRAWAWMVSNSDSTHLQAEPLNLGDRNGVLKSKFANSQTGFLETSTDFVDCHFPNGIYRSNLHYSIRWPNGVLTSDQQTGLFEARATLICI